MPKTSASLRPQSTSLSAKQEDWMFYLQRANELKEAKRLERQKQEAKKKAKNAKTPEFATPSTKTLAIE